MPSEEEGGEGGEKAGNVEKRAGFWNRRPTPPQRDCTNKRRTKKGSSFFLLLSPSIRPHSLPIFRSFAFSSEVAERGNLAGGRSGGGRKLIFPPIERGRKKKRRETNSNFRGAKMYFFFLLPRVQESAYWKRAKYCLRQREKNFPFIFAV